MPEDSVAVSLLLRKHRDTFSISRNWANIWPTYNFHLMKVLSSAGIQWGQHQPEARHLQLAEMQRGSQQAAALRDCMLDTQSLRLQGWITLAPNKQLHQKVSNGGETEISGLSVLKLESELRANVLGGLFINCPACLNISSLCQFWSRRVDGEWNDTNMIPAAPVTSPVNTLTFPRTHSARLNSCNKVKNVTLSLRTPRVLRLG